MTGEMNEANSVIAIASPYTLRSARKNLDGKKTRVGKVMNTHIAFGHVVTGEGKGAFWDDAHPNFNYAPNIYFQNDGVSNGPLWWIHANGPSNKTKSAPPNLTSLPKASLCSQLTLL